MTKLVCAVFLATTALGWLTAHHLEASSPAVSNSIWAEAADRLPAQTAADWVTYADHVVVATLTADSETELTAQEVAAGEGLTGRTVSMRVERTLWSRRSAPVLPEIVSWQTTGWYYKHGKRHQFQIIGAPRIEPGVEYLIALVEIPEFAEWSPLSVSDSVMPLSGRRVTLPEHAAMTPMQVAIMEREEDDVTNILKNASVHTEAAPYMHLEPIRRFRFASAENPE